MNARRFYREVSVEAIAEREYRILLDGKAVHTPARALFVVPNAAFAEAIASEWRGQTGTIRPETMILTKLANTALDSVRLNRETAIAQILAFAKSDLLCYRADHPDSLVQRQAAAWDPLLDWARTRYGANLAWASGIVPVEQTPQALAALERALANRDAFMLAGLHRAAALLGSAVVALALMDGRVSAGEAFAASQLDELYQAERWGEDSEAIKLSRNKANELSDIEKLFVFLRQ